jgi:muconolactone delta-isomerase
MSQYMVSMNLLKADPLLDIGQLTNIVTQKILPSLDALKDLQSQGKVLAGGHPVGQRYVVLFMEAESEDEVRRVLGELPLSELGDMQVTELKSFEELQDPGKRSRRGLLP